MTRMPLLVRQILRLIAASVIIGVSYNAFSTKGLPFLRSAPVKVDVSDDALFHDRDTSKSPATVSPDTGKVSAPPVYAPLHERALKNHDSVASVVRREKSEKESVFRIISLSQMQRLLREKRGLVFDARSAEDFRKGHIAGARNIYGLEPDSHFEELASIQRDSLIVIYCNNPECHLGRSLAEFVNALGFKRVYLYDDGWDGWTAAGLPVDSTMRGY